MNELAMIELIIFFKRITIEEHDITTEIERRNGQLVLNVTYIFDGQVFKTGNLYYKNISIVNNVREIENVIKEFGNKVFWLDVSYHHWPADANNVNIEQICWDISSNQVVFKDFLYENFYQNLLALKSLIIADVRYGRNLETNNHWHDIIKLVQAYINTKGCEINNSNYSRMVYKWARNNAGRTSLSPNLGNRQFLYNLQQNIKMVQPTLQNMEIQNLLLSNYQIILQGPPGTGKTRTAKEIAYSLINNEELPTNEDERKFKLQELSSGNHYKLIQFHPAYTYEDFVRGIVAKTENNGIVYEVKNKVLAEMASDACKSPNDKFVLIIDEINRANLSSVLGELIYALEYRGEEVESMYALRTEGGENRKIVLPKNLFIIGTMNTADRSLGNIDYALRRRFVFESILPNQNIINIPEALASFLIVEQIFTAHLSPEYEKNEVMIGHSYFLGDNWREKLKHQVKPLLKEYVKDGVLLLTEDALISINNLQ